MGTFFEVLGEEKHFSEPEAQPLGEIFGTVRFFQTLVKANLYRI